ncbi:hypothetical protein [Levilactobacillus suantsaiihabitans]|uniref:Uncharacterized protein n=2 Tax=Levilactobacillus TaxID=2767886 RepID=A0A4Z0J8J4_9LACO|nr:hypothetical protein [Levilactobacillus suantsaiihabitans]TGD18463.1 hypothetical protein EGT51_08270 [Levilactobacillus suantsaiihabitans]
MLDIRIDHSLTGLYQISLALMVILAVIVVPLVQKHWHRRFPILESMWWQLAPILAFSAVQIAYVTFNLFLGGLFLLIDLMLILDGYQRQQARLHRHH